MALSKSLYIRAIQCPKALWLKQHAPKVITLPGATAQARFETGKLVGELVHELFLGGRKVAFNPSDFNGMAETTQQWLEEGIEFIYEATFIYEGIIVLVDILRQVPNGVEIYEVKSSTEVKEHYLHDVSIQQYVLEQLGYSVVKTHVVHIDKTYVRGDSLDLDGLFNIVDVTAETTVLQGDIPNRIAEFGAILTDGENEPEQTPQCRPPYPCCGSFGRLPAVYPN